MITLPFNKTISQDSPMFIIAEVGSNFKTKEDCLKSINDAKVFGADAVKFQLYDENSFYYKPTPREGALPFEWIKELKEYADKREIEFMCSAFSPKLLEALNPFVNIHKLASAEMCHVEMLDQFVSYKKPVIVSTGGHATNEIRQVCAHLESIPKVLLYCIANYPARHTNVHKITDMQKRYNVPIGLSDHSLECFSVPERAQELGAVVLEKHVNFIDCVSDDSPHSISSYEFTAMVNFLRGNTKMNLECFDKEEESMVVQHHRRLIASKDISYGDKFILNDNYGIYRSDRRDTHGFNPFMAPYLNEKTSRKDIKAGESIGPGDF